MAINLAKKASPKVVERFKIGSCTEGLFSSDYNWTGVRTVQVYSVDTLPMVDYDITKVDGSSRFGALTEVGDTMQEMTIEKDRAFNGTIDKGNNTSQLQIKAASKVLKRQTDEVLIPEVDKYRLNKMATWSDTVGGVTYAPLTKTVTAAQISKANIVQTIMEANAQMSNELVPDTGRVLYMGYTDAIQLKIADQVVGIDKLGEKAIVNGVMGKIDKCQVRLVPDSYLPTGVKFMIVKTGVAIAPKKIETFRILNDVHILDGAMVQGRLMHDCFVLNSKVKGILVAST